MDVFEFPANRESFTGMNFFYHSVLPFNVFEIGCKKPSKTRAKSVKCLDIMSKHIAKLVGHLQHFGRTMSDVRQ